MIADHSLSEGCLSWTRSWPVLVAPPCIAYSRTKPKALMLKEDLRVPQPSRPDSQSLDLITSCAIHSLCISKQFHLRSLMCQL